ncbi:hypothetical protein VHEMI01925 [[Torrubiella] hemipterigena]|uniref:Uncharacterized protein n=1 Tax=[Torrubiella] hemipterigena TaxID=1531966 RepID=A0A0A1T6P3_9HYPO|nr:hypothetical protein VHEMI01925 [[Torrubiella] hemipterigena]
MDSEERPALDPAAITKGPNQLHDFTLQPIIADILRTRYCTPRSIFIIEGIDIIPVSTSGRWQAVRLLLGDGELCVQAILSPSCHRFVQTGEVFVGCYVCVDEFRVEWVENPENEESEDAHDKKMVFLVLRDISTLGWNQAYRDLASRAEIRQGKRAEVVIPPAKTQEPFKVDDDDDDDYFEGMDLDRLDPIVVQPDKKIVTEPEPLPVLPIQSKELETLSMNEFNTDDEFGDLDELLFPSRRGSPAKSTPRTRTPRHATPSRLSPSKQPHRDQSPSKQPPSRNQSPSKHANTVSLAHRHPVALPRDWTDITKPLKLTTLHAIPHLPYAQNWTCNVLAIIVSLSPVESSYLPPYTQRTARIVDPSTAKQVHLTVFLDAESFSPKVGSAVLLTGVKNHSFDGGSLKKYASDKGGKWWFEDPVEMTWCDVRGIKDWWKLMEDSMKAQAESAG